MARPHASQPRATGSFVWLLLLGHDQGVTVAQSLVVQLLSRRRAGAGSAVGLTFETTGFVISWSCAFLKRTLRSLPDYLSRAHASIFALVFALWQLAHDH